MEPENAEGNVEYKLKITDKDDNRIEKLASQMRYRCNEGNGECIYNIGVRDNGELEGISQDDYDKTVETLNIMAKKNNYSVTLLSKVQASYEKYVYEVLIREKVENSYIDIKVAVAGNVDAAKSTTIGTLISGKNDNGRGLTRSQVFNYIHEIQSGRTSSVAHQILGFDFKGNIVNYQGLNKLTWSEITQKSSKLISFFDLAGHEKYIRTTIQGLTSSFPDFVMIMIACNNGISSMTKEHIFLCTVLRIPYIIVFSKMDLCADKPQLVQETVKNVNRFISCPAIRKIMVPVKEMEGIMTAVKNLYNQSIVPCFYISNVTGDGLDILKKFLNTVGKNPDNLPKNTAKDVEYYIDNIFNVYGVGIVVGGHLLSGTVKLGDKLRLGPINGAYEIVTVKSIHIKRTSVTTAISGQYVCFSLKRTEKTKIRKGSVLLSLELPPLCIRKFKAKIQVLRTHSTTVKIGYEPTLNAYSVRQTVRILDIEDKRNARNVPLEDTVLRNGDSAIVKLEFRYRPEYLKPGTRFILCEGKCKIVGEVS